MPTSTAPSANWRCSGRAERFGGCRSRPLGILGLRSLASHPGKRIGKAHADIVHPENDEGPLYQSEVIHILNEFGDENSTTIHASGGVPGDIHKLWNCKAAMDYHSEYGYSCMGYEIAGAMGVKMADPNREVYALVGDGSLYDA